MVYPWNNLFTGNQQAYFLWAADMAGYGNFQADPLLAQADPFPLFSLLAASVFSVLPLGFFHVIYWLLNAVYSFALFGVADAMTGIYLRFRTTFVFTILFLFLHSAEIWGTFFNALTGFDLRWIWDSGLAEQGVLRGYLQPSAFGVFMLLGVYHATKKNWKMTAIGFGIASVFHANYLIMCWAGLVMVLAYLATRKTLDRQKLMMAGAYFLATAPYAVYILLNFLPDKETGTAVLANISGNPHLDLSTWINLKTGLQLGVFTISVIFLRKTKIGKWMIGVLLVSLVFSVIAFALPTLPLLSLNPWRVTVILFPMATALLLGLIVQSLRPGNYVGLLLLPISVMLISLVHLRIFGSGAPEYNQIWTRSTLALMGMALVLGWLTRKFPKGFSAQVKNTMALGSIMLLMAAGAVGKFIEYRVLKAQPWAGAADHVLVNSEPGDLYLIPPHINNFRMNAGVGIVADPLVVHGSTLASQFQRQELAASCFENDVLVEDQLSRLKDLPITHVLTRDPSPDQTIVYQDSSFAIIKLR